MKKVVVTGMGVVSPFGVGVDTLWDSLKANKNGISFNNDPKLLNEITQISGKVPKVAFDQYRDDVPHVFDRIPEDDSVRTFFLAVSEAVKQSGVEFGPGESTERTGVFIADRTINSTAYIDQYVPLFHQARTGNTIEKKKFSELIEKYPVGKLTPFDDPDSLNHYVSRAYGIYGPQLSVGTACASGNNAIGEAFCEIREGRLDTVICGGAFNFDMIGMVGFTRIEALTSHPDPETACRPFDKRRSGFVMGSGCGVLILEDEAKAKARGAHILAELSGYASLGEAYRSTDPDPEVKITQKTIRNALATAQLNPSDINYVNAHGTSTVMNDQMETKALKKVFGEQMYNIPVSSSKSMIGHSIMAAGAIEGIVSIKSIEENVIHPTHNWEIPDEDMDLDYVPNAARDHKVDHVLSNNFGFGGQNASVIFSRFAA